MSISEESGGMKLIGWLKAVTVVAAVMAVPACTSLNSKVGGLYNADTDLKLALKADADINPDDRKRPSPLFLRLYELKSAKQFEKANFIDLFERDSEVLGADLVAKQTLKRLRPGDERTDRLVLKPETRYVGVFAEFLQYKDAKFKILVPIAPTNVFASSADVHISGNAISNTGEVDSTREAGNTKEADDAKETGNIRKKIGKTKEVVDSAKEGKEVIDSAREIAR